MKFYGRSRELKLLGKTGKRFFIVLWGRRRIGKTSIAVRAFDHSLYFFVGRKSPSLLLEEFSEVVRRDWRYIPTFKDWDEFFIYLFKEYPGTIIMDEFQNFFYADPSVFTTLQRVLDEVPDHRMVVVGSYVGMMKRIFMDSKEPLFGRVTGNMRIQPLPFHVVCDILDDLGVSGMEEKVSIYSVFGGTPYHYVLMDNYGVKSFEEALERLIFSQLAPLRSEVKNVLVEEFGRNYSTYFSVLQTISSGKSSISEIANKSGIPVQSLGKYIQELMEVYDLVERITPIDGNKRGVYRVRDPFTRFWFRYVESHISDLESGRGDTALERAVNDRSMIASWEFETIVRELIGTEYGRVGTWWNRSGEEIDAVGIDDDKKRVLFAEVKWTSRKTGTKELKDLKTKAGSVKVGKGYDQRYLLISRSGFSGIVPDKGTALWDLHEIERRVRSKILLDRRTDQGVRNDR